MQQLLEDFLYLKRIVYYCSCLLQMRRQKLIWMVCALQAESSVHVAEESEGECISYPASESLINTQNVTRELSTEPVDCRGSGRRSPDDHQTRIFS